MSGRPEIESFINTFPDLKITNITDKTTWKKYVETLSKAWKKGNANDVKECASQMLKFKPAKRRLIGNSLTGLQDIANGEWIPDKKARPASSRIRTDATGSSTPPRTDATGSSTPPRLLVEGVKKTAEQRQNAQELTSKLCMVQKRMAEIISTMEEKQTSSGARQKNEPKASVNGDLNMIVDTIFGQTQSILSSYTEVKKRCDDNHVDHNTIQAKLVNLCKVLNVDIHVHGMGAEDTLSKLLMQEYVRLEDVQTQVIELYERLTSLEYKLPPQPKNSQGQKKPESKCGSKDFGWALNDIEDKLKKFMQRSSLDSLEGIRKANAEKNTLEQDRNALQSRTHALIDRLMEAQARLKAMFKKLTNKEYKEEKKTQGKSQNDESKNTDQLPAIIEDTEKEIETIMKLQTEELEKSRNEKDQARLASVEDRLRKLFQTVTTIAYKDDIPNKPEKKGKSEKTSEDVLVLIDDMGTKISSHLKANADDLEEKRRKAEQGRTEKEETIVDLKNRLASVEDRLKELFQTLTGSEYKEDIQRKQGKKEKSEKTTGDVFVLIADMDTKIRSHLRTKTDDLEKNQKKADQYLKEQQKALADLESRLEERLRKMCQTLTITEYKKGVEGKQRQKVTSDKKSGDLLVLIDDMETAILNHVKSKTSELEEIKKGKEKEKTNEDMKNGNASNMVKKDEMVKELKGMYKKCTGEQYPVESKKSDALSDTLDAMTKLLKHKCDRFPDTEERLKRMFFQLTSKTYVGNPNQERNKGKKKKPDDLAVSGAEETIDLIDDMEQKLKQLHSEMVAKQDILDSLETLYQGCTGERFEYRTQSRDESSQEQFNKVILTLTRQLKEKFQSLQGSRDEARQLDRDYRTLETGLKTYEEKVADLEAKNEDLLTRLSQVVSAKLLNNNPDIADLSDADRPTKLAEQYSELYDNAWTDAFDILTKKVKADDPKAISILLGYLTSSYAQCLYYSEMQELLMEGLIMLPATVTSQMDQSDSRIDEAQLRKKTYQLKGKLGDVNLKMLTDLRKQTRLLSVQDIIKAGLPVVLKDKKDDAVRKYVTECLQLCWLMCQQQPRVYIDVEVTSYQGSFDKGLYREYMKKGKKVDYVVWPTLYLQKGGNILVKGVANGK